MPTISASSSLQKYTVRVKKPENKIFKFFDPSRVFQRARACRNIRFGSKNRKTKSSSFLTRACGNLQQPGQQHTHTHTRTSTHIGPGPGEEACDAAWPGRACRGGCGQLLRRAAETPEHLAHAHTCASTRIKGRRDAGTFGTCACAQARTPPHRKPTPQKKGVCKLEDLVFRFFDPNRIFRQAQARTVLCTKVVPT